MEEYKHASHHQKSITLKRAQCMFAGPQLIQIPSANLGNHFCDQLASFLYSFCP